ncbi:uncharacterized protein DS421_16g566460 [Arachis hypogaea]|nr:uncharacterized protein DS421_16g566460 [Arachis hypogaea]
MSEDVVSVFYHGESFVRDNKGVFVYINGEVKKFLPMDIDLICLFDLKKFFLNLSYHDYKAMYWYDPISADLESGLQPIHGDKEIRALQKNKMLNEDIDEFYIYFDRPIIKNIEFIDDDNVSVKEIDVQKISVKNNGVDNDANIESSDSDDEYESAEDELYKSPPFRYSFRIQVKMKSQSEVIRKGRVMRRRNLQ